MSRVRLLNLLVFAQLLAGVRVVWRLIRSAGGERIERRDAPLPNERVTIIVPVMNEFDRLGPCLKGLILQGCEVAEILVVDGGSVDGTQGLVAEYQERDARVRLVDAAPVPLSWNGKAYGLQVGLERSDPSSAWILTIDADVRVRPTLVRSMLAHAVRTGDAAISIATPQHLSGAAEGLIHPALLTTLVYRFGIPGHATRRTAEVQANGQCCLFRRVPLQLSGGFAVARGSLCEDVTVARALADAGHTIGFYEADDLIGVEMYASWREAWWNWPRSLPLRDRYSGATGWIGLVEIALTQALPLPLLCLMRGGAPRPRLPQGINLALLLMRLGVLVGTTRAYPRRPWTYWLSPLTDLPVTVQLWRSALSRRHEWRGRLLIRDDTGEQQ